MNERGGSFQLFHAAVRTHPLTTIHPVLPVYRAAFFSISLSPVYTRGRTGDCVQGMQPGTISSRWNGVYTPWVSGHVSISPGAKAVSSIILQQIPHIPPAGDDVGMLQVRQDCIAPMDTSVLRHSPDIFRDKIFPGSVLSDRNNGNQAIVEISKREKGIYPQFILQRGSYPEIPA